MLIGMMQRLFPLFGSNRILEGNLFGDVLYEEDYERTIETSSVDVKTIKIRNISINNIDTTRFQDDPQAQMDGGAKFSMTNLLNILMDVEWFNNQYQFI